MAMDMQALQRQALLAMLNLNAGPADTGTASVTTWKILV
jgi:hypothetical protein